MKSDGSDVKRLTNRPGPDGGPFFSWDGKQVAFRGKPEQGPELESYRALLKEGLWRPTELERPPPALSLLGAQLPDVDPSE